MVQFAELIIHKNVYAFSHRLKGESTEHGLSLDDLIWRKYAVGSEIVLEVGTF